MSRPGSRPRLTGAEWRRLGGVGASVAALHALGWGVLLLAAPAHPAAGAQAFGVGLGLTAYVLGVRHAFDADHITAIDNTTRSLMGGPRRPLTVGFWFSLGHSSVVLALSGLLAFGVRWAVGAAGQSPDALRRGLGVAGLLVSGIFLILIGLVNLVALVGIAKVFARMRRGELDEAELARRLAARGLLARAVGRVSRTVRAPWQMYPVGLLFGLGFDTASEVGLLVLAGSSTAAGLPWYAILSLPVLFAAGMSLFDTADGALMTAAYGWAFTQPVRKVFYNLTVTGLSVVVALAIGGVELLGVLARQAGLRGGFWGAVAGVDLNTVGFLLVAVFAAVWAGAVAAWRLGRVEQRWGRRVGDAQE